MAYRSAAASPFCRPEEDPFLLLESSLKAIERILQLRRGLPLRRTWIEQPYGEEEIRILEEEVIPAIQQCLSRVDELDERLLAQQELLLSACLRCCVGAWVRGSMPALIQVFSSRACLRASASRTAG
jgi:hypothetical protein